MTRGRLALCGDLPVTQKHVQQGLMASSKAVAANSTKNMVQYNEGSHCHSSSALQGLCTTTCTALRQPLPMNAILQVMC